MPLNWETPAGVADDVNTIFTAAFGISEEILAVDRLVQLPGVDYSTSDKQILFAVPPTTGAIVRIRYTAVPSPVSVAALAAVGTGSSSATAAPRDLALDATGDLYLAATGDIAIVTTVDVTGIVQHVRQRLQLFRGEWFLAPTEGLPYFQVVLVKSPNPNAIRQAFIDAIEGTPGITKVDRLDLFVDAPNRRLQIGWTAGTDLGEVAADVFKIAS